MSDFILSKHGKGKTAHYFYMENRPNGIKKLGSKRFCAMYNTKGLGTFDTIQEAMNAYNNEKSKALKQVADEYKTQIPQKLYDALYNWIPDDYIVHK